MQAIAETLFDVVYLVTVITMGIVMITKNQGNRQYRLFGRPWGWWFLPLNPAGCGPLHHGLRELHRILRRREAHHFHYHDGLLYPSVLCMENTVSHQRLSDNHTYGIPAVHGACYSLPLPAEHVVTCRCASLLGRLPQHSLCVIGAADHCPVL